MPVVEPTVTPVNIRADVTQTQEMPTITLGEVMESSAVAEPQVGATDTPSGVTATRLQHAPEQASRKLDKAAANGLLRGKGGKLRRPEHPVVNPGPEQVSDTISKYRE
jgi:hypothetical protein